MSIFDRIATSPSRFFLYYGGFYILGVFATMNYQGFMLLPHFWAFFIFFTIGFNLLMLQMDEKRDFIIFSLMFVLSVFVANTVLIKFLIGAMSFLAVSHKFLLAKKAPFFLDVITSSYAVFPLFIGFLQFNDNTISLQMIIGILSWGIGMYLFTLASKDTKTRKLLGADSIIIGTGALWSIAAFSIIFSMRLLPWSLFALFYPLIIALLLLHKTKTYLRFYWLFPFINATFALGVYLYIVFKI